MDNFFVGRRESGDGYEFRAKGAVVVQVVRLQQRGDEWVPDGEAVPPPEALGAAETLHGLDLHVWEARDGVTASVEVDSSNVWWVASVRYTRSGRVARRPATCGGTHPTAQLARRDAEDWASSAARGAPVRWA